MIRCFVGAGFTPALIRGNRKGYPYNGDIEIGG